MTIKDKRSLLPHIEMMMGLALISRTHGLLALEELLPFIESHLIWIGIRLIVEGITEECLRLILDNYIESDRHHLSDLELLRLKVECQCLMDIQNGTSPELMRDMALSIIGSDIAQEVYSSMNGYQPYSQESRDWENERSLELRGEPEEPDEELEYLIEMSTNEVLSKTFFLLSKYEIDRLLSRLSIASRKKLYYSRPENTRTLFIHSVLTCPYHDNEKSLQVQEDMKKLLEKQMSWVCRKNAVS